MRAKSIAVFMAPGLAFLLMAAGLSGCADSPSSDFKSYGELDGSHEPGEVGADEDSTVSEATDTNTSDVEERTEDREPTEQRAVADDGQTSNFPDTEVVDGASAETAEPAVSDPADVHGDVPAIAEKPLPETELAAAPKKIELLIKDHEFSTEGGHLRVSYDDIDLLRVLNMEPVTPNAPELMPKWLRDLDGKRVRIRGFMYPPFEETGIERFVLARDNQICCFGRNPKVYDLIDVQMRSGETTHYIQNRPFDVTGVFHIAPVADPDLLQLYSIDDAQVIER